jgi:hypothetical protein
MWVPSDRNLYALVKDWGGVIGGVFALIAGYWAYRAGRIQATATRQASDNQIAASARKDHLQAQCIAAGISSEIDHVKENIKRVRAVIEAERTFDGSWEKYAKEIEERRHEIQIDDPPLIKENVVQLFILGNAGATLLELRGLILQHNRLVADVDPSGPLCNLRGRLKTMERLVERAQEEIAPIRDQQ